MNANLERMRTEGGKARVEDICIMPSPSSVEMAWESTDVRHAKVLVELTGLGASIAAKIDSNH